VAGGVGLGLTGLKETVRGSSALRSWVRSWRLFGPRPRSSLGPLSEGVVVEAAAAECTVLCRLLSWASSWVCIGIWQKDCTRATGRT
jgi:hypothetical protein